MVRAFTPVTALFIAAEGSIRAQNVPGIYPNCSRAQAGGYPLGSSGIGAADSTPQAIDTVIGHSHCFLFIIVRNDTLDRAEYLLPGLGHMVSAIYKNSRFEKETLFIYAGSQAVTAIS